MQAGKEKASNVAASARAGLEKTKATLEEKGERMTTRDPLRKELATERKEERMTEAELEKQRAREYNAAQRQAGAAGVHGAHPTGHTGYGGTTTQPHPTGDTGYGGTTEYGATTTDVAAGHGGMPPGEAGSGGGGIFSTTGYRATDPRHGTGGT